MTIEEYDNISKEFRRLFPAEKVSYITCVADGSIIGNVPATEGNKWILRQYFYYEITCFGPDENQTWEILGTID